MKKSKKPGFAVRLIFVISALLITVNLILGMVLVHHSTDALKTMIHNRMLDIANTAADMLDGDTLKTLKKEDEGTEPYQKIIDQLTVFQNNIDLEYIYCIQDLGNGEFVFSVDPTVDDPGEFGSPIVTTDALSTAAKGTAAVDKEPYTDKWGRFYSAYSPVFDSDGKVAGIVAVDFSAAWYDNQVAKQTRTIIFGTIGSLFLGVVLVIIATARMRREMIHITEDITDVAKDIDELNRELDPDYVKESAEIRSTDDVHGLSKRIHQAKEGLRLYTENLHSQAKNMITALTPDYRGIYYIDLDKNEGTSYKSFNLENIHLDEGDRYKYSENIRSYAELYVTEKYREEFLRYLDPEHIRKALENERFLTFRYMIYQNGTETYEMAHIARMDQPDDDSGDRSVHTVAMGFSDVDAEMRRTLMQSKALKDALAAAEVANKAKTAFLSNMSHEIRTPMNAIIGLDRIALSEPDIPEKTRDHLEKIGSSAEHLLKIINDILDMTRIEAGEMVLRSEVFSLPSLIAQVNAIIGEQCRDSKLEWHPEIIGKIDDCYLGDDMKLKQVLINILGNAVKFTDEGGSVFFTIECTAQYDGKSVIRFVVRDTGIGIDPEFLPRLFDSFSQEDASTKTKYGSTGLGMSITKSIIEMMNGDIQVESEKNVGTTFTVTVTLTQANQTSDDSDEIDPHELSILIVDNDPIDLEYSKMELEKIGIACETAASGAEAIEMIRIKNARREAFSLILMDWKMPEMDGMEASSRISAEFDERPIIFFLTAVPFDEIIDEAHDAGVDGFITKPMHVDDMLRQYRHTAAARLNDAQETVSLQGRRILLAEDVEVNAEIIRMLLQMREVEVDCAVNGKIAVEMFSTHDEGYYDAILMDMRMPEMDGLEVTRAIRALDRPDASAIPIIALTANAFDEDVERSLQAGLNAHLSKPVEPDNLFKTLESLIKP